MRLSIEDPICALYNMSEWELVVRLAPRVYSGLEQTVPPSSRGMKISPLYLSKRNALHMDPWGDAKG